MAESDQNGLLILNQARERLQKLHCQCPVDDAAVRGEVVS